MNIQSVSENCPANGTCGFNPKMTEKEEPTVIKFIHEDGSSAVFSKNDDGTYKVGNMAKPGYCGSILRNLSAEDALEAIMNEIERVENGGGSIDILG